MKMILSLAGALALAALTTAPVSAGTYKLPKQDSIISITFPSGWSVTENEEDGTLEAVTKDQEIYFYLETVDAEGVENAVQESVDYLAEQGVQVPAENLEQREGKAGDLEYVELTGAGEDEDGPCLVNIAVVTVSDDAGVLILYWGSAEATQKHVKDVQGVFQSLKKVKAASEKEEAGDDEQPKKKKKK